MVELLEEYWLDPNFNVKTAVLNVAALGQLRDRRAFEESVKRVQGLISLQTDVANARLTLNYSPKEVEANALKQKVAEIIAQNI